MDAERRIAEYREARALAKKTQDHAGKLLRQVIRELTDAGWGPVRIAEALGVTRQRLHAVTSKKASQRQPR